MQLQTVFSPMRVARSIVGLVFVVLVAAACNGDSLTAAQVAGTWSLARIGGAPLPVTVQDSGGTTIVIQSDQFVLGADGSFTETIVQVQTVNGVTSTIPFTLKGVYFIDGKAITINYIDDGTQAVGDIEGTSMTFGGGSSFSEVYVKQ